MLLPLHYAQDEVQKGSGNEDMNGRKRKALAVLRQNAKDEHPKTVVIE